MADILEKQCQDSHDIKEENLGKWDATTKTGIPQEVITRYDNMKDPNFIMTKTEMKKFKNTLTLSKTSTKQEQNYVLSPLNGTQFIIYCDSTLFQYLCNQSKRD